LQKIAVSDQDNWRKLFESEGPLFFFVVPGEKTLDGASLSSHGARCQVIRS